MTTASTAPDYLDPHTVQRLLAAAEIPRDAALLRLLAGYGVRPTEAVRLRVADVNLARCTVAVCGKAVRWRTLPIDEETMGVIGALTNGRKDGEPLFTDHQGRPITEHAVTRILRKCAARTGITGCSVRLLRRSMGNNLLRAGATIAAVAALLGIRPRGILREGTVKDIAAAIKRLEE